MILDGHGPRCCACEKVRRGSLFILSSKCTHIKKREITISLSRHLPPRGLRKMSFIALLRDLRVRRAPVLGNVVESHPERPHRTRQERAQQYGRFVLVRASLRWRLPRRLAFWSAFITSFVVWLGAGSDSVYLSSGKMNRTSFNWLSVRSSLVSGTRSSYRVEGKGGCLSRLLDLGGNLRPLENVRVRESASSMMPSAGQWTVKSGDGGVSDSRKSSEGVGRAQVKRGGGLACGWTDGAVLRGLLAQSARDGLEAQPRPSIHKLTTLCLEGKIGLGCLAHRLPRSWRRLLGGGAIPAAAAPRSRFTPNRRLPRRRTQLAKQIPLPTQRRWGYSGLVNGLSAASMVSSTTCPFSRPAQRPGAGPSTGAK